MDFEYNHQPYLEKPKKKSSKIKMLFVVFMLFAAYGFITGKYKSEETSENETTEAEIIQSEEQEGVLGDKITRYTISEGDIPADIFKNHGNFDANDTAALLEASTDVYDFTNLKIGQDICFYFNEGEKATRMEYDRNTETIIVAERNGEEFTVQEKNIDYEVTQEVASATIENFLYADALEAGLSEATVLEIGDIFAFNIDFTTEIRKGDSFTVIYEKRTRNGEEGPDGKVLAAKFINEGEVYYAYYFEDDGEGDHYDAEGRVLLRQFLRAPLSYRRITSGYTGARYHPITRTVSAHYQIDYAAPVGTPVVSTARGTVASAGWEGGWGYIVRLRHDNGFTTHYGHLSSFAKGVRSGASVSQGQVIGYVGSTGWSTGPHLDYGMRLNGAPVNPLSLKLPKGNPLPDDKMGIFEETKNKYADMLN